MGNPLVLLLDEPSEGLAPIVVATIGKVLRELGTSGATILLAEPALSGDVAIVLRTQPIS
jgi:branched-chain amino acid transport system ATP-binding protein